MKTNEEKWKEEFLQFKIDENNKAANCYGCSYHETEWMDGGYSTNLCNLKNESHDNDGCDKRDPKKPYIVQSEEAAYIAARNKAQEEIDKKHTLLLSITKDKDAMLERESNLKIENLNMRHILQKLQKDLDRDEHVDSFWMKDLFPEAQEIEKRDKLIEQAKPWMKGMADRNVKGNLHEVWIKEVEELKL